MSAHSPKRGDWVNVSSLRYGDRADAEQAAREWRREHPERRFRTYGLVSLGYVVQTFVERASAKGETR